MCLDPGARRRLKSRQRDRQQGGLACSIAGEEGSGGVWAFVKSWCAVSDKQGLSIRLMRLAGPRQAGGNMVQSIGSGVVKRQFARSKDARQGRGLESVAYP